MQLHIMSEFYTYVHCKPDGSVFYVGKGTGRRAYDLKRSNKHHSAIVNKYGATNISVYVFECDSEEQALLDEIQQIKQLRDEGWKLANVTDGGEGASGYSHDIKAKEIISKTHKGSKRSDDTREKMSAYAKNRSEEHLNKLCASRDKCIEAMRSANLGKKRSEETLKKIAESSKGRITPRFTGKTHTEEAKLKISASKKGIKAKPFSDEHRNNISEARKKYFANKKTHDVQLLNIGDLPK